MSDSGILYFPLQGLIPAEHRLALHQSSGVLVHLYYDCGPCIQGIAQFTGSELLVLLPLLRSYPACCLYAHLLACYNSGGRSSEALVEQVSKWLDEAGDTEVRETQLRPIRNVLSRVRLKCLQLGFDITSVLGEGYLLCTAPDRIPAMSARASELSQKGDYDATNHA